MQRFWDKALPEPNSGCWLWIGAVNAGGYGSFGIGSRTDKSRRIVTASRLAYQLIHGDVPDGLQVLHKCDNTLCVNPEHLYVGTRSQNMQDAYDRGRQPFRGGSIHPQAKLNEDKVKEILASNESGLALAKKFGCSSAVIYRVRNKQGWRHVSD